MPQRYSVWSAGQSPAPRTAQSRPTHCLHTMYTKHSEAGSRCLIRFKVTMSAVTCHRLAVAE